MDQTRLTPRQLSQIAVLEVLPPKFDQINRIVEEMAGLRADAAMVQRLCRMLDESKSAASTMGLPALADTLGMMGSLARRTGGLQMKVRGLREGLGSLRINFEGAWRSATTPVDDPSASSPPGDRSAGPT